MTVPAPQSGTMGDVKTTMIACYMKTVSPGSTVCPRARTSTAAERFRGAVVTSVGCVQGDIAAAEATLAELKKQPLYTISTLKVLAPLACPCALPPGSGTRLGTVTFAAAPVL